MAARIDELKKPPLKRRLPKKVEEILFGSSYRYSDSQGEWLILEALKDDYKAGQQNRIKGIVINRDMGCQLVYEGKLLPKHLLKMRVKRKGTAVNLCLDRVEFRTPKGRRRLPLIISNRAKYAVATVDEKGRVIE